MKKLAALTLSLFLMTGIAFADSPKDTPKDTPKDAPKAADAQPAKTATAAKPAAVKTNAEIAAEMEELRQALQAQQEQLQLLKEELANRDKQIEEAREAAASANSRATEANVKATEAATTSAEVKSTETALNSSVANLEASNAAAASTAAPSTAAATDAQNAAGSEQGPTTIRFKGVNITPGGFVAAETATRTHSTGDELGTGFSSIPYNGNPLSKQDETIFTARQTRLTTLVDTKIGGNIVKGYVEADFLGVGTTSNPRQTNSYVLRQRQLWASVTSESGWSVTGGQQWSLATEDKKGIQNLQEWTPMMVDPNYIVGWFWERAYGFRVVKNFNDKLAFGVSIEGPDATLGGRGFTTYTSTSATGVVTTSQNFFLNVPGVGAGLANAFDSTTSTTNAGYTLNKLPDFVFKAALDPGWGHYEVFGIVSTFRNRVYPCAVSSIQASNASGTVILDGAPIAPNPICVSDTGAALTTPSAVGAYNSSVTSGGGGVSAHVPVGHKLDLGVKVSVGDGINRFGGAQLVDATARPNGTLALLKGEQSLVRLEFHPTPKFDIYAYWGNEYAGRAGYTGYATVAGVATPGIPATLTGGPGGTPTPAVPGTTTWTVKQNQIGGYGNVLANNSGCAEETTPSAADAPGAGGTCAGDIRNILQYTLGFWHKMYQGEKGRLQWGVQYSYLVKSAWSGAGGLAAGSAGFAPKASDNLIFTSFRYYLP
jgi:hypothetical protein